MTEGLASPQWTDDQVRLAASLLVDEHRPARFCLLGIIRDTDGGVVDLELVGYGLQMPGTAFAYLPSTPRSRTTTWHGSSVRTLMTRHGGDDLLVHWIDQES
ncbi:hypothetical protein [Amycolatopsis sp. CA-230715]|uniref:hypothetical protein n=1 Tax=Amycolatopsis sp. CA-230715 TaxID=2745196 RepID=UPI001C00FB96|nr:hypothetical protein [Amycolatopsis sp. CA-230715]QWF78324.1 hypothetical protein HUW46_01719 [Amycolatopsis sp. CA-230715]